MTFLNSFEAVRYRGIDGLSFPHLARVNLITGVNGIGKTAALEAMWLFTGRYNTALLWNGNVQRSANTVLDPVARLAHGALELRGIENGSEHSMMFSFRTLSSMERPRQPNVHDPMGKTLAMPPVVGKIDNYVDGRLPKQSTPAIQPTPLGSVVFHEHELPTARAVCIILGTISVPDVPNEYLQRFSDVVRANYKKEFTKALNLILPNVQDPEILADEKGESYLSAVMQDGTRLPLRDLGSGFVKLYQLFLDIFSARGGIIFVDELENGLHHSILEDVWTHARVWMQQWDVQFVATTHSDECIEAAMAAFEDTPDELAIHKLFSNAETGKVEAMTFTGEALLGARELNLETR